LIGLSALAVAGWLGDHGKLPTPEPVREAVSSAEAWREERIAVLQCRVAVLTALASADDDEAIRLLEAACDDGSHPARATVSLPCRSALTPTNSRRSDCVPGTVGA
jgi:hypothetical protein